MIDQRPARLLSLDAFRGLAIAGMIVVNNPGSWSHIYWPLEHAEWNGWTPTDLIFPFFVFIVGVSLTFSFARRVEQGAGRGGLRAKALRRAGLIFLTGLILNFIPRFDPSTVRIPGVLQRIALAYAGAALIHLYVRPRARPWLAATLLIAYWVAMRFVPVPGYGAGVLEPIGNLAQYVDSHLLHGHMWKAEWDPEGLLSTIPAIGTCLLGTFAGELLRSDRAAAAKARGLALPGVAAVVLAYLWNLDFPINKSLWTSSYVLLTGGLAALCLAALYWIIDVRQRRAWARPLLIFGSNALLVFVLSGLVARILGVWTVGAPDDRTSLWSWLYEHAFAAWAGPTNGSLAMALVFLLIWLVAMTPLYRRGWLLRF